MAKENENLTARFDRVFEHFGAVARFADRRGSRDPEVIAAETMAIAWRKLRSINPDSCRPWLLATARNLLRAEYRNDRETPVDGTTIDLPDDSPPAFLVDSLDPAVDRALATLEPLDREAVLLIAWDELTPKEAAESLGVSRTAFRVRLHRARKRFAAAFEPELDSRITPIPREERT